MTNRIKYDDWQARAKIDFISLWCPKTLASGEDAGLWLAVATESRIDVWLRENAIGLTIHDPDHAILQFLINKYPNHEIVGLEIATDLTLVDGTNNPEKLAHAHRWLTHVLFPFKHPRMRDCGRRWYYDGQDRKVKRDGLRSQAGAKTVYWNNPARQETVRLYVKTIDNKKLIPRHSTRIEISLTRGGCQNAGVAQFRDLPAFASKLRRYVAPFFHVGVGIKPKVRRSRAASQSAAALRTEYENTKLTAEAARNWGSFGASWAGVHGADVQPDRDANTMIGGALNDLRRELMKLRAPQKKGKSPITIDDIALN